MDDTIEEKGISKTEIKIITALGCFSVVWFFLIIPFLMGSKKFLLLNPVFQYISLNISLIFFIYLFFGYFLGMVINSGHRNMMKDLTRSLSVFVFSEFVINVWTAPFVVSRDTVLYFEDKALIGASVDGMLAYVFNQMLGIGSEAWLFGFSQLYILIYLLVPMGVTVFLLVALTNKQSRDLLLF